MTPTHPASIGRYEILDLLGQGAMGIVYRARDPLLDRVVAIKVLQVRRTPGLDGGPPNHERFMREARTAGKLDHPNIVRVHDVGCEEESGEPYMVMEYLAGPSLEKVMQDFEMAHEQVLTLLDQLVSAIDTAHVAGIVHGDIKPANILFTEDGETAKIADFGLARFVDSNATQDIRRLGTPIYMSPEQATGKRADGRTDLFSLGVLCYHLLAKRTPYEGQDIASVAYQVVHSEPALISSCAPWLPHGLDAVMTRILDKDPELRYPTGRNFYEALRAVLLPAAVQTKDEPTATVVSAGRDPLVRSASTAVVKNESARVATRKSASVASSPEPYRGPAPKLPADPAKAPLRAPGSRSWRRLGLFLAAGLIGMLVIIYVSTRPAEERAAQQVPNAVPVQAEQPEMAPPVETTEPLPGRSTIVENEAAQRPAPRENRQQESKARRSVSQRAISPPVVAPATPLVPEQGSSESQPPQVAQAEEAPQPVAPGRLIVKLRHRINSGTLTLLVDGRPVLTGDFAKKKLVLSKVSEWEPVKIAEGRHKVTAKVVGGKGKQYRSAPLDVTMPAGGALSLIITMQEDRLELLRE